MPRLPSWPNQFSASARFKYGSLLGTRLYQRSITIYNNLQLLTIMGDCGCATSGTCSCEPGTCTCEHCIVSLRGMWNSSLKANYCSTNSKTRPRWLHIFAIISWMGSCCYGYFLFEWRLTRPRVGYWLFNDSSTSVVISDGKGVYLPFIL